MQSSQFMREKSDDEVIDKGISIPRNGSIPPPPPPRVSTSSAAPTSFIVGSYSSPSVPIQPHLYHFHPAAVPHQMRRSSSPSSFRNHHFRKSSRSTSVPSAFPPLLTSSSAPPPPPPPTKCPDEDDGKELRGQYALGVEEAEWQDAPLLAWTRPRSKISRDRPHHRHPSPPDGDETCEEDGNDHVDKEKTSSLMPLHPQPTMSLSASPSYLRLEPPRLPDHIIHVPEMSLQPPARVQDPPSRSSYASFTTSSHHMDSESESEEEDAPPPNFLLSFPIHSPPPPSPSPSTIPFANHNSHYSRRQLGPLPNQSTGTYNRRSSGYDFVQDVLTIFAPASWRQRKGRRGRGPGPVITPSNQGDAQPLIDPRLRRSPTISVNGPEPQPRGSSGEETLDWMRRLYRGGGPSEPSPLEPSGTSAWIHVTDMDEFLTRVYQFHRGKGTLCIVCKRLTKLASILFILWLTVFMTVCIDHAEIRKKSRLSDVIHDQCLNRVPSFPYFLLILFVIWWGYQFFQLILELPKLLEMGHFYAQVLGFSPHQVTTLPWADVVNRLTESFGEATNDMNHPTCSAAFSPQYPRTRRRPLDAMEIANRLMRQENYMIALFNKDILNLRLPFLKSRQMLTRVMEWTLQLCIFSFVFEQPGASGRGSAGQGGGKLRKRVLRVQNRAVLAWQLRRRFFIVGLMSLLVSPVIFTFLVIYFAFSYTQEIHENPSSLHVRQFTPFALWRFREFNELEHVFAYRLSKAEARADHYLSQFPPHPLLIIAAKFILFVAASLASALLFLSLFDEDWSKAFDITPGRSVVFWLGLLAVVIALCRHHAAPTFLQDYSPATALRACAEATHYLPAAWRTPQDPTHPRREFVRLYELRILVLAQELLSVLSVPWLLLVALPPNAEAIVDFFREFSVHVDGLGYVCSFALFDFKRHGNEQYGGGAGGIGRSSHLASAHGKMEASFVNFSQEYRDWKPEGESARFLETALRQQAQPSNEPPVENGGRKMGGARWAAVHERGLSAPGSSSILQEDAAGRMRTSSVFKIVDDLFLMQNRLVCGGGGGR